VLLSAERNNGAVFLCFGEPKLGLFRSICHEIAVKMEKLGPHDLMRTY
jgi:uncharacterized metal-binding protein